MPSFESTILNAGQTTIPYEVMKSWEFKPGDRIVWRLDGFSAKHATVTRHDEKRRLDSERLSEAVRTLSEMGASISTART